MEDCLLSAQSPLLDGSDELQAPLRSPSRLDFCMQATDEADNSPTQAMDWSCPFFCRESPYTCVDGGGIPVDIAPSDPPSPLTVDGGIDHPPPTADSNNHENTDTLDMFFAPPDPTDHIAIEPQAPIPVRPPSAQILVDAQGPVPPSPLATQRLNYPHHGFSRSALLHQKNFWNSRQEEWAEWQSCTQQGKPQMQDSENNDAYTGIAIPQVASLPPYMRTPPSGLERDLTPHPSRTSEQDASIYPRVGDIPALRDPYPAKVDRSFSNLPLWTLHKALYTFDMQQRSLTSSPAATNVAHFQASTSSSTLSTYTSSTSGDDEESDSSLVIDDGLVPKTQRSLEPLKFTSSLHSPPSWSRFCRWDLPWYSRWKLLIDIFQHDHSGIDAFDTPSRAASPDSAAAPASHTGRIFRFTVEDEDDYDDGDDEEDYGTIVADSSFSVDFNEECERALAFYRRELGCS